ncbi:hypothetical protein ORV05_21305 [Amycolatopsis cynarae]|uniref:PLL-like beta propeller domain-containing protein n=1 Tax=Amycolatopsis cynarae TaxID=2995223 RepID=A0ABY7AU98_9PSEU|nr:hypothetical protein [Amycolatopsis sp. HUAS 11-8]WAL63542.1 hypothetical protein ORV05_21305 [Amycolatopsis sp. HUAS 11-8]
MFRRLGVVVAALAAAVTVLVAPQAPVAHADAAGGGGDFVPLASTPVVFDTRNGTGGTSAPLGAGATATFPVLGVGGIPTTGVGSVLARITLLGPTASTWAELWPDGTSRPTLTMVSATAGEDLSNTAVVKVGANGKIAVYNSGGKADIAVEVQGYYKAQQGTTGGGLFAVPHTRLIDTRSGLGTTTATIAAGATRTVTLTGGVIPAGAAAAQVNLLVPSASAAGWLSAAPSGGTQRPVMNYETGSTQQGSVLTLPSSGQVTFTNRGSAAINLVVTAEGYYSSSSTQGSGLRQVAGRLFNTRTTGAGLPIPANSTVDVQVGGTFGMPTHGVAAAALSLVATPESDGYLKAWPVGDAEPSVSIMDFKAGKWRANALVLKPGTDGRIRIRNGSSGTTHVIVDLQGWFANPLPGVAVAQNTPMTAMQAAPVAGATVGTLEYAYTDNAGRVVYGHQTDPDNFGSVQWTVISGNEAFSGQPALSQLSDGRIQVTAQHTDSDVWADTQTASGASTWNPWENFGGSMAGAPVTGKLSDGTVMQFDTDTDGKLWVYAQSGAVPYWRDLGDQNLAASTLSVAQVRDGLRVFGVDGAGAIKTVEYYNDGSVSPWTDLGGSGLSGRPAVVVRPGYLLQVFARAADGTIVAKLANSDGSWPADYQSLGGFTSAGAPAAIMDPALGRLAVVVRGSDNEIYHVWETVTGSNTWGSWTKTIGATDPSATDPTTSPYTNSNGQSWMITFRNVNGATRFYERQLSGM